MAMQPKAHMPAKVWESNVLVKKKADIKVSFAMIYKIRKAVSTDIEEIINLCGEHAEFERAEFSLANKAEKLANSLFSDNPQLFCLVVESDNRGILGYATFTKEFSTWDADFFIHLDCLF
jgi:hypothetical protein